MERDGIEWRNETEVEMKRVLMKIGLGMMSTSPSVLETSETSFCERGTGNINI
jgi:hypothetical protein